MANCKSCGKLFSRAAYLKKHIHKVHKGHKDNKCESCGKSYTVAHNGRKACSNEKSKVVKT